MSLSVLFAAAWSLKPVPWIVVLGLSSVQRWESRPSFFFVDVVAGFSGLDIGSLRDVRVLLVEGSFGIVTTDDEQALRMETAENCFEIL